MRYAVARAPSRVVVPGLAQPIPIVQEAPQRPPAVVLSFLPPARPAEPVGAPRAAIDPAPPPTTAVVTSFIATSSGVPAIAVGVREGGTTKLTMTPANLWDGPRSDISEFTIVSIAAGSWE